MKAAESKTTTATQPLQAKAEAQQPFFQAQSEQQGAFFGQKTPAAKPFFSPFIQTKLSIGQPGDKYEQEADAMAEQVVQKLSSGKNEAPIQRKCAECAAQEQEEGIAPKLQLKSIFESNEEPAGGQLQRKCEACAVEKIQPMRIQRMGNEEEAELQAKGDVPGLQASADLESRLNSTKGGGSPLSDETRTAMESSFGTDFSGVRVHTNSGAVQMNQELGAQAFTHGSDVYFNSGKYDPGSTEGNRLLGHELTHVVQQGGGNYLQSRSIDSSIVQRALGDGHDLTSPRFSRLLDLEAAYDGEDIIRKGKSGQGVQAIQQALYDLGFTLRRYGANGVFNQETKAALKAFQRANPPLNDDGQVGTLTMAALDRRFGAITLPPSSTLSAPWTPAGVCAILCPWSPHTIDILQSRITLKSFDDISWADEEWDGASWIPSPFPGGGYNTGREIGVLNSSNEDMAETLYHEVLHAQQPRTHSTTMQREAYAYRIGEEFSIAMGLGGMPSLRSTDAQGREFADEAKVETFVATEYPSVPAGGGGDEIVGKAPHTHGYVEVERPNGSRYIRPAVRGEKVPGAETLVGETIHPNTAWTCP